MSRYFYSRYSLISIIFLFFVATIISLNFKKALAETSITENFAITNGTDSTTGSVTTFSLSEVSNLNLNDNNRVGSNNAWPVIASGSYDENKYLEFVFSPNVPSNATISSVKITHKYNRSGSLAGAKLEVWDGADFSNSVSVTLEGASSHDVIDIVDSSSYINTFEKANGLKVRFLAYRNSDIS